MKKTREKKKKKNVKEKGINKRKIYGCPKGIGLGDIFRNFLWKRKKQLTFVIAFFISYKTGIQSSLSGPLINALGTH